MPDKEETKLAVLEERMQNVQKDIADIKQSVNDTSKEISSFLLKLATEYKNNTQLDTIVTELKQGFADEIKDVRTLATTRLWQVSGASIFLGVLLSGFAQFIFQKLFTP